MISNVGTFYQYLPPEPFGTSLRADAFLRALLKVNAVVDVYTTTQDSNLVHDDLRILSFKNILNDRSRSGFIRLLAEIFIGLRVGLNIFFKKKYDYFVVSSPSYFASIIIVLFLRLKKIPFVFDVRDTYPEALIHSKVISQKSLIARALFFITKKTYGNAFLVLAATKGLSEQILSLEPSSNVYVSYNGYPSSFKDLNPIKFKRFTLCFHGTLGYFQDIELLIKTASIVESYNIDVIVIGAGRKEALFYSTIPNNLKYLGGLSFTKTIEEVSKCHLGLCFRTGDPLSSSAFPIKVWEYIGLGIPTLITPHCEGGKFVTEYGCGYQFSEGDVGAIVDTVIDLAITNKDRHTGMVKCAVDIRDAYTRELQSELAVDKIIHSYRKIAT